MAIGFFSSSSSFRIASKQKRLRVGVWHNFQWLLACPTQFHDFLRTSFGSRFLSLHLSVVVHRHCHLIANGNEMDTHSGRRRWKNTLRLRHAPKRFGYESKRKLAFSSCAIEFSATIILSTTCSYGNR